MGWNPTTLHELIQWPRHKQLPCTSNREWKNPGPLEELCGDSGGMITVKLLQEYRVDFKDNKLTSEMVKY